VLQTIRAQRTGNFSGLVKTRRSPSVNEDFLKVLIQWMSNGVQLILYLRDNNFQMNRSRGHKSSPGVDMKTAFHELAAGIEEVVIFSFQQTIYTITKVYYFIYTNKPLKNVSFKGYTWCGHIHLNILLFRLLLLVQLAVIVGLCTYICINL